MLPKINRLPGYKIPLVLASRTTFHSPLFTLKVKPSKETTPKIGFIVSKKTAKKAVDRNRIKRLLRQAIKPSLSKIRSGLNLLFLAKPAIKDKSLTQLKTNISAILKRANLLSL